MINYLHLKNIKTATSNKGFFYFSKIKYTYERESKKRKTKKLDNGNLIDSLLVAPVKNKS